MQTKKQLGRKMVNLSPYGVSLLNDRASRINKERAKIGKPDIKINTLLEAALENLTVEMGVVK